MTRAHLGEFGIVVPKGIYNVERLIVACEQAELPAPAHKAMSLLADHLIDTQLSGFTPYESICKVWTSEPDRFIVNLIHQMPGLNI